MNKQLCKVKPIMSESERERERERVNNASPAEALAEVGRETIGQQL